MIPIIIIGAAIIGSFGFVVEFFFIKRSNRIRHDYFQARFLLKTIAYLHGVIDTAIHSNQPK
ncbi:hypothetical protein IAH99_13910 [Vibrio cholerae]|uniref:hypothetical protein n=1 Tax=Vibrio cholerae TaxID=666 RepID=UPI00165844CA|nr:hypothetical protein [Vibrio cholerae]MBC9069440.1 hypothetical protein [Vibrio cholerae]